HGHRAHGAAAARHPGHPSVLGERPALPETVLMKVPLSWLREYARVDATTEQLVHALSISTAEVNGVERIGVPGDLSLFRVGHVLEAGKHPDADRLQPGTPLADVLPLVDEVLDVEPTGNRVDLLSVYGIAREVAALFDGELVPLDPTEPARAGDEPVDVRVEDSEGCPRYIGRLFRDVAIGESPIWLRARLRAAGVRSISTVVDVTNYVMLAVGNPPHA